MINSNNMKNLKIFSSDTDAEHELVKSAALKAGAFAAVVCSHWSEGGAGAVELADAVINACKDSKNFKFLYDLELPLLDKMNIIAQNMYGAAKVELTPTAQNALEKLTKAVSFQELKTKNQEFQTKIL